MGDINDSIKFENEYKTNDFVSTATAAGMMEYLPFMLILRIQLCARECVLEIFMGFCAG